MRRVLGLDRPRDERGASAILFAILALALMGVSAVAVDMGQVYAKRSSLQSAADHAVLAAAAELDGTNICTQAAVDAATKYLRDNWIDDSGDPINVDLTGSPGDPTGFIKCTGWNVKLWAPDATVNFGLAKAVSNVSSVEVPAYAEAGVFSPATGVMPAFAVTGCDYGPQTLLDPPGGHETVYIPTLPESTGAFTPYPDVNLNSAPNGVSPAVITLNQFSALDIYASANPANKSLAGVNVISFSTEDGAIVKVPITASPVPFTVTAGQLHLTEIPSAVRTVEKVWWVRVSRDNGAHWSSPQTALPLRVGDPLLECAGASNEGNFGTIDLPHLDPSANATNAIAWNIATKVDFDLTTLGGTNGYCTPGVGGAVDPTDDGTNCVQAQTGFAGNPATAGLITGPTNGTPGRLDKTPTASGCDRNGGSSDFETPKIQGTKYMINDDTLTCFFTNSSTTISTIATPGYNSGEVINADVFKSPRFFWVPVFDVQPSTGNSNHYSIVDFRPAFITGELGGSTKAASVFDSGTDNGLSFASAGIESLKVVFFDPDALPESMAGGPVMTYLGVGTKVIVLVD
ncbi:TadE/TadG family type IV pilus assembly protein [Nocardioides sp. Soil796]|uniref:TadE/TadG family type IV pilus assembly protein n=1 Tax=Nocardioides sp. Soil796 TaxID=1736412 RepID=UPI00070CB210|nr:pilus assembly protein TadG-related protein [Nocardioides sp. Soil796]KRF12638.1 hypothetical protein ASH02_13885 [Nocardioides sp. Soil796]